MKTKYLLGASAVAGVVLCVPMAAHSVFATCQTYSATDYMKCRALSGGTACAKTAELHYGDSSQCFNVSSCDTCPGGLKRVPKIQTVSCGTIVYYSCQTECDCTTTAWSADGRDGVQKRTYCDELTCESSLQFQCAPGWYGLATLAKNNCAQCPSLGGVAGQSPAGSGFISKCFIPAGTAFSDDSGTGVFANDCNYTDDGVILGPSIGL